MTTSPPRAATERQPRTAAPIRRGRTAAPTGPRNRTSMLSRCVGVDPDAFAAQYWARRPLMTRSDQLPRDFGDLLSADAVDELIAERGVRAPFIRLAKQGQVLAHDCYLGGAGFGAEIADQVDSAKVLAEFA